MIGRATSALAWHMVGPAQVAAVILMGVGGRQFGRRAPAPHAETQSKVSSCLRKREKVRGVCA